MTQRFILLKTPKQNSINIDSLVENLKCGLTSYKKEQLNGIDLLTKDGDIYPEKTDICCWWDRHKFNTVPIGIPIIYEKNNGIHIFYLEGFFCSFECCQSYIKENTHPSYKKSLQYLKNIFFSIYPTTELKDALNWKLLKISGYGTLDIDSFRKNNLIISRTYDYILVPLVITYS